MRWATYSSTTANAPLAAVLHGGRLHALPPDLTLTSVIADGDAGMAAAAERATREPFEVVEPGDVRILAPIGRPPAFRDFMAFAEHYESGMAGLGLETDPLYYRQPTFHFSNPAAILGPTDLVPVAPGSVKFDYELEVAVVIGKGGRNISPAAAEEHIAGYTILCDWSARDHQLQEMTLRIGPAKGKDTATSLGPHLVTKDELEPRRAGHGFDLAMTAHVNGVLYSSGNWSSMSWPFADLIAYASRGTTLVPGDIIGGGTVGTGCILELSIVHGGDRYPWLKAGDDVELTIAEVGTIRTTLTAADEIIPLSATPTAPVPTS
ncbi:fumarylacetoacetate hydrolase family protein [Pseudonocardia xishanensis]|uniref:Fumarylacetoacetase-like C-terminal domain-containing protein n=1 Tax=Pseudonocardia xishanensis TaxID=630995 RepID=A0ABP8RHR4_9PSEU